MAARRKASGGRTNERRRVVCIRVPGARRSPLIACDDRRSELYHDPVASEAPRQPTKTERKEKSRKTPPRALAEKREKSAAREMRRKRRGERAEVPLGIEEAEARRRKNARDVLPIASCGTYGERRWSAAETPHNNGLRMSA